MDKTRWVVQDEVHSGGLNLVGWGWFWPLPGPIPVSIPFLYLGTYGVMGDNEPENDTFLISVLWNTHTQKHTDTQSTCKWKHILLKSIMQRKIYALGRCLGLPIKYSILGGRMGEWDMVTEEQTQRTSKSKKNSLQPRLLLPISSPRCNLLTFKQTELL